MSDMYYGFSENTDPVNNGYSQESGNNNSYGSPAEPPKKKKGGSGKKAVRLIGSGAVFGLTAGLVFWGVSSVTVFNHSSSTAQIPSTTLEQQESSDTSSETVESSTISDTVSGTATAATDTAGAVSAIAKECKSSVVAITTTSVEEVQSFFGTQSYQTQGAGSGIIVAQNDDELLIATNNHVVSGAQTLSVCFDDDKDQVYEGAIKGTDPDNDLAVVAVNLSDLSDATKSSIKIATMGDSDNLEVGEQIVAIGNALGYGQSVTTGIVSALNREVTIDNTTSSLIQVDAAINPGNSGGALFNMKGELVGINSAKYASEEVEGMGYAIPITKAKDILDNLMTRQTRTKVDEAKRGYLGISCLDVSSDASQMYNLPSGVYVKEVGQGGAAEAAGIKAGDIITKFDGLSVSSKEALVSTLENYAAGETVEVVVERASEDGYKEITLQVTLAKQVMSDSSTKNSQGGQSQSDAGNDNDSQDQDTQSSLGDLFGFKRQK
ncbi:MAG: trypsin-like peptidase domain-containing protein [Lachnospiraceae bacterium]